MLNSQVQKKIKEAYKEAVKLGGQDPEKYHLNDILGYEDYLKAAGLFEIVSIFHPKFKGYFLICNAAGVICEVNESPQLL